MGRSEKNKKKKTGATAQLQDGFLLVDPAQVRFQHSRIRPYFSGCGRSISETLESIRKREMSPSDLPPIQVIVGPETENGPTYFSLNNRRLWVLKRCREEGLLENNSMKVRVRLPKSDAEAARYSIENCVLEAKIIKEPEKLCRQHNKGTDIKQNLGGANDSEAIESATTNNKSELVREQQLGTTDDGSDEESDTDDENDGIAIQNPFNVLL